jgi:hypothetical protein
MKIQVEEIHCDDETIVSTTKTKILGIIIDQNLIWVDHVDFVCKELSSVIIITFGTLSTITSFPKFGVSEKIIDKILYYCRYYIKSFIFMQEYNFRNIRNKMIS